MTTLTTDEQAISSIAWHPKIVRVLPAWSPTLLKDDDDGDDNDDEIVNQRESDAEAGHPFYGNQYVAGMGGNPDTVFANQIKAGDSFLDHTGAAHLAASDATFAADLRDNPIDHPVWSIKTTDGKTMHFPGDHELTKPSAQQMMTNTTKPAKDVDKGDLVAIDNHVFPVAQKPTTEDNEVTITDKGNGHGEDHEHVVDRDARVTVTTPATTPQPDDTGSYGVLLPTQWSKLPSGLLPGLPLSANSMETAEYAVNLSPTQLLDQFNSAAPGSMDREALASIILGRQAMIDQQNKYFLAKAPHDALATHGNPDAYRPSTLQKTIDEVEAKSDAARGTMPLAQSSYLQNFTATLKQHLNDPVTKDVANAFSHVASSTYLNAAAIDPNVKESSRVYQNKLLGIADAYKFLSKGWIQELTDPSKPGDGASNTDDTSQTEDDTKNNEPAQLVRHAPVMTKVSDLSRGDVMSPESIAKLASKFFMTPPDNEPHVIMKINQTGTTNIVLDNGLNLFASKVAKVGVVGKVTTFNTATSIKNVKAGDRIYSTAGDVVIDVDTIGTDPNDGNPLTHVTGTMTGTDYPFDSSVLPDSIAVVIPKDGWKKSDISFAKTKLDESQSTNVSTDAEKAKAAEDAEDNEQLTGDSKLVSIGDGSTTKVPLWFKMPAKVGGDDEGKMDDGYLLQNNRQAETYFEKNGLWQPGLFSGNAALSNYKGSGYSAMNKASALGQAGREAGQYSKGTYRDIGQLQALLHNYTNAKPIILHRKTKDTIFKKMAPDGQMSSLLGRTVSMNAFVSTMYGTKVGIAVAGLKPGEKAVDLQLRVDPGVHMVATSDEREVVLEAGTQWHIDRMQSVGNKTYMQVRVSPPEKNTWFSRLADEFSKNDHDEQDDDDDYYEHHYSGYGSDEDYDEDEDDQDQDDEDSDKDKSTDSSSVAESVTKNPEETTWKHARKNTIAVDPDGYSYNISHVSQDPNNPGIVHIASQHVAEAVPDSLSMNENDKIDVYPRQVVSVKHLVQQYKNSSAKHNLTVSVAGHIFVPNQVEESKNNDGLVLLHHGGHTHIVPMMSHLIAVK